LIICDTSGLIAAYSARDEHHQLVAEILRNDRGLLVVSPFVLAELDYMMSQRAGVGQELKVLGDVAAGIYTLPDFDRFAIAQVAALVERYKHLRIGLADASIVVLAAQYGTTRLLTLDERHFRAIRPLHAAAFTILPADG
jgi:predicted nucleic acid-binding protein